MGVGVGVAGGGGLGGRMIVDKAWLRRRKDGTGRTSIFPYRLSGFGHRLASWLAGKFLDFLFSCFYFGAKGTEASTSASVAFVDDACRSEWRLVKI